MRSGKRYSNATFTKRVDHDAGRHRTRRSDPEPAYCQSCGAIWAERRWSLPSSTESRQMLPRRMRMTSQATDHARLFSGSSSVICGWTRSGKAIKYPPVPRLPG